MEVSMSIIYNGKTISSGGTIKYNNISLNKILKLPTPIGVLNLEKSIL
jgi:hypothetical protein